MTIRALLEARWRYRWKGNHAEGKYVRAEVSKGHFGWAFEVETLSTPPKFLDSNGTIYKMDAKHDAEEAIAKWDATIEKLVTHFGSLEKALKSL